MKLAALILLFAVPSFAAEGNLGRSLAGGNTNARQNAGVQTEVVPSEAKSQRTNRQADGRTLDAFAAKLNKELTPKTAEKLFGKPDRRLGSGLIIYEYELAEGAAIRLGFPGYAPILYARLSNKGGSVEELPLK